MSEFQSPRQEARSRSLPQDSSGRPESAIEKPSTTAQALGDEKTGHAEHDQAPSTGEIIAWRDIVYREWATTLDHSCAFRLTPLLGERLARPAALWMVGFCSAVTALCGVVFLAPLGKFKWPLALAITWAVAATTWPLYRRNEWWRKPAANRCPGWCATC